MRERILARVATKYLATEEFNGQPASISLMKLALRLTSLENSEL